MTKIYLVVLAVFFVTTINLRAETKCEDAFKEKLPIKVDFEKMDTYYCGVASSIIEATGGEVMVVYELYENNYLVEILRYKIGIKRDGGTVFYRESVRIFKHENGFEEFDLRDGACLKKIYLWKCYSWQKLGPEEVTKRNPTIASIITQDYLIKKFSGSVR